jgi:hypothetical protein
MSSIHKNATYDFQKSFLLILFVFLYFRVFVVKIKKESK